MNTTNMSADNTQTLNEYAQNVTVPELRVLLERLRNYTPVRDRIWSILRTMLNYQPLPDAENPLDYLVAPDLPRTFFFPDDVFDAIRPRDSPDSPPGQPQQRRRRTTLTLEMFDWWPFQMSSHLAVHTEQGRQYMVIGHPLFGNRNTPTAKEYISNLIKYTTFKKDGGYIQDDKDATSIFLGLHEFIGFFGLRRERMVEEPGLGELLQQVVGRLEVHFNDDAVALYNATHILKEHDPENWVDITDYFCTLETCDDILSDDTLRELKKYHLKWQQLVYEQDNVAVRD